MARTAKDGELLSEPTKVRVKHFKNKNFGGGYSAKVPATSVNPEQIYDLADYDNVVETLKAEGIETEEIERF